MNDRYLYRAKRTDNGEWVEGNLVWSYDADDDYNAIIIPTTDSNMFTRGGARGDLGFENWFRVEPSTICQCTGLKDKNGKLIWENDIVELYDRNTDYRWRAVVTFGNPNCEYTWGWQLKPIGECEANTDILCWINMEESGALCDVIGSSIDNRELLEVGE